jgi:hypothetical protein
MPLCARLWKLRIEKCAKAHERSALRQRAAGSQAVAYRQGAVWPTTEPRPTAEKICNASRPGMTLSPTSPPAAIVRANAALRTALE